MKSLRFNRGRELTLAMLCVLLFSLLGPAPAKAAIGGYSEYFIPGGTNQLFRVLQNIDNDFQLGNAFGVGNCATGTVPAGGQGGCNYMHNIVTVSVTANTTTIYYDHWENGYSTGSAGDEVYVANKGAVLVFESGNILVPRVAASACVSTNPNGASTQCYDGRDRIYVAGGAVSVAEAFWPEVMGTVFANAWEVYPVKPYQNSYTIPVGEDLFTNLGYQDFTNVYALVMAANDATSVQIDNPATAGVEVNVNLNKGEVTELFHISTGTTVTSSKPVQVQFIVGVLNAGLPSDSRSYTAVPSGLWETSYYNPVPGGSVANTDIYVYNPNASPLTFNYEDSLGAGTFSVPAGSTRRYSNLTGHFVPQDSAVYLASGDGVSKFWAIGSFDSQNADFNYGFTLIPTSILTTEYYIGWAPGSTDLSANGSPVFVTPVQDGTTVFVDYGPADGVVDATYTLDRIEIAKLRDPDNNNTGMHIWASGPIAITWGEDDNFATVAYPFIDAGYTVLPLNSNWIDPVLSLAKTADPAAIPAEIGQVVTFTLVVNSNVALDPANVTDNLPVGWAYVPSSTVITRPGGVVVSGAAAEPAIAGQNLTWNNVSPGGLVPGQPLSVAFKAVTTAVPTLGYIINTADVSGSLGAETFTATANANVQVSKLSLKKASSAGGTTTAGGSITYTIDVTNNGEVAQTNLVINDALPAGTTYVPASTQITYPALQGAAGDPFDAIAFNGNLDGNGAVAPNWVGDWAEIGEADGAAAGDVQVMTDQGNYQLRLQGASNGVARDLDLAGCTSAYLNLGYRRAVLNAATDLVRLSIGKAGAVTDTLFDFVGPTPDAAYQGYQVNITNWIDSQTRIQLLSSATLGAAESIFFDNVQIDCYTSASAAGGAPPSLVTALDGYNLLSGQGMTITYQVTVNNPVPAGQTSVVNTAETTSDQQVTPLKATTVDNLLALLDPPFGIKVFDDNGLPLLQWTMVWINNSNNVPLTVAVSDPLAAGTTYSATGASSGFAVPLSAPTGSTNIGVTCQPDPTSVSTTTSLCYYERPTATFPQGRIIWAGVLGPDFGAVDAASAKNEISITFRMTVADSLNEVLNQATIDADLNQNNSLADPGESQVAQASARWQRAAPQPTDSGTTSSAKAAPTPAPTLQPPFLIPVTGFTPGQVSQVRPQPETMKYAAYSDLALKIPALGVSMPVVGVPQADGTWDVSWLGASAGYLDGTAFPTWVGNSVLTGHVYLANGLPGPFLNLGSLKWGDRIIVAAFGQQYIYEVRAVYTVRPTDLRPLGHKDEAWLTLITCKQYDAKTDSYKLRTIVQAVMVGVVQPAGR